MLYVSMLICRQVTTEVKYGNLAPPKQRSTNKTACRNQYGNSNKSFKKCSLYVLVHWVSQYIFHTFQYFPMMGNENALENSHYITLAFVNVGSGCYAEFHSSMFSVLYLEFVVWLLKAFT